MPKKDTDSELIRSGKGPAFSRWQLPSFDADALNVISAQEPEPDEPEEELLEPVEPEPEPELEVEVEEIELEEVQPITLEEVEAIRQDAYNEGFATGEKEGFQAGQLRAQQEAEAALKPRLQALESLMQQLFEPINQQDQAIEHMLLELVSMVSKEVVQHELKLSSAQISRVLREAMKLLPLDDGQVRIHVNPQDFATIKSLRERHEADWRILEDEELLPGGCRVETLHSQIDASIETRLHTLAQQLLEQRRQLQAEPIAADQHQEFDLTPEPIQAGLEAEIAQALTEPSADFEQPVEPSEALNAEPNEPLPSLEELVDMQLMGDPEAEDEI